MKIQHPYAYTWAASRWCREVRSWYLPELITLLKKKKNFFFRKRDVSSKDFEDS